MSCVCVSPLQRAFVCTLDYHLLTLLTAASPEILSSIAESCSISARKSVQDTCGLSVQADHEKFCRRAKEVAVAREDTRDATPAASSSEAASLYKKQDLSLKQGETLKCA